MKLRSKIQLAAVFAMCLSGAANASLVGDSVGVTEYYPTFGDVYGTPSAPQVIVPGGNTFPLVGLSPININITGSVITLNSTTPYTPDSAAFNGFAITDYNPNTTITGVSLDGASLSLPPGFLSFDSHHIFVDVAGVYISGPLVIDVSSSTVDPAPVPEPETYAMLVAGLGLLGAVARRKSRQQA